ncbi:MAG: hypothetical protein HZY75_13105 [Nocardioidaceae bacterium]|nr:MAG: hypothetical protein HZY75_13105 [Nocardioidaceae bacterium]
MKRQLEYLLDYFTDPENAITVDALLDTAFSVGDEHGIDKTLRNWTIEDLASVTTTRYRVSAEAVAASKAFDETASEIMRRMRLYGAQTLGQVPWGDSPAGAA